MAKMSIRFILKSGAEFTVKCDNVTIQRNGLGVITNYSFSGITENKPIDVDMTQVAAVIRVLSDEAEEVPNVE